MTVIRFQLLVWNRAGIGDVITQIQSCSDSFQVASVWPFSDDIISERGQAVADVSKKGHDLFMPFSLCQAGNREELQGIRRVFVGTVIGGRSRVNTLFIEAGIQDAGRFVREMTPVKLSGRLGVAQDLLRDPISPRKEVEPPARQFGQK